MGAGLVIAALLAATASHAQDNGAATVPAPAVERYSLPPGNGQATPAPTPAPSTPTPSLTPAPPPSVVPTLRIPTTVRTPSPTPMPSPPTPRPTPAATSTGVAPSPATPAVTATPEPLPTMPAPAAIEPAASSEPAPTAAGPPAWLWWVAGLVLIAVLGFVAWRRFGAGRADTIAYVPDAAAPAPVAPPAPTPGPPARPLGAAAPLPDRALVVDFRPQRLWTLGPDAHLAFELVVTNSGAEPVDAVRPVIALASAGPDTAAEIAAFQASLQTLPGGEPFALRAGETRSVVGELTLPGDAMYVTSVANRELIVPVALVGLHWRAGVSLARLNEAFVIGTGDTTTARLGPIWVDRAGLVYARLDARRFTPGSL